MKICRDYVGVSCADGSCSKADAEKRYGRTIAIIIRLWTAFKGEDL